MTEPDLEFYEDSTVYEFVEDVTVLELTTPGPKGDPGDPGDPGDGADIVVSETQPVGYEGLLWVKPL